jgi:hypothetical protein
MIGSEFSVTEFSRFAVSVVGIPCFDVPLKEFVACFMVL